MATCRCEVEFHQFFVFHCVGVVQLSVWNFGMESLRF